MIHDALLQAATKQSDHLTWPDAAVLIFLIAAIVVVAYFLITR